jgi:hypothetical protein
MPNKDKKPKKEPMISIFDPSRNAYFEAPISLAKQFVASAKETEKELAKIEEENE